MAHLRAESACPESVRTIGLAMKRGPGATPGPGSTHPLRSRRTRGGRAPRRSACRAVCRDASGPPSRARSEPAVRGCRPAASRSGAIAPPSARRGRGRCAGTPPGRARSPHARAAAARHRTRPHRGADRPADVPAPARRSSATESASARISVRVSSRASAASRRSPAQPLGKIAEAGDRHHSQPAGQVDHRDHASGARGQGLGILHRLQVDVVVHRRGKPVEDAHRSALQTQDALPGVVTLVRRQVQDPVETLDRVQVPPRQGGEQRPELLLRGAILDMGGA